MCPQGLNVNPGSSESMWNAASFPFFQGQIAVDVLYYLTSYGWMRLAAKNEACDTQQLFKVYGKCLNMLRTLRNSKFQGD